MHCPCMRSSGWDDHKQTRSGAESLFVVVHRNPRALARSDAHAALQRPNAGNETTRSGPLKPKPLTQSFS